MNLFYVMSLLFITSHSQNVDTDCQEKLNLLTSKGFVDSSFNRPCLSNPCNSSSLPFNTTGNDCPAYCGNVNGDCLSKVLRYVDVESRSREQTVSLFQNAAQTNMASIAANTNPRSFSQTGVQDAQDVYKHIFFAQLLINSGNSFRVMCDEIGHPLSGIPGTLSYSSESDGEHLLRHYGCKISRLAFTCNLDFSDLQHLSSLIEPPVNIPYCLRIPCNNSNAKAERDFVACQSNPGCYFDQELAYRHEGFTIGSLPGVPVCYQAIHNNNFLRLAHAFSQMTNQPWNPLYTRCLINQAMPAIREPPPGCHVLKLLHNVDIHPKIAGWKEMTEMDCILIKGCYFPELDYDGYNCFYPARINPDFIAEDDNNDDQYDAEDDVYGRHICQLFRKDTSESYLNSYHQCKLSGCVVDESVTVQKLHNQFLNVMLSKEVGISPHARPYFWNHVKSGIITPGNWKEKLETEQPCDILQAENSNAFFDSFLLTYNEELFRSRVFARQRADLNTASINSNSRAFPFNLCDILSSNADSLIPIPYPTTVPPTPGIIPFVFQYPLSGIQSTVNPSSSARAPQARINFQGLGNSGANSINRSRNIASHRVDFSPNSHGATFSSNSFINLIRRGSVSNRLATNINLQNNRFLGLLCRRAHSSPGCLYQDLNFENYPPLKGSFEGCCERHLCYVKKEKMFQQHSGPQNYWSRFGEWTSCNATCGGGSRKRTRICEMYVKKSPGCLGSAYQTQVCNSQECAYWSSWEEYGTCSVTCGYGMQARNRTCSDGKQIVLNQNCKGTSIESKKCNLRDCPIYGPWSSYNDCSCGRGVKRRQRQCIRNCNEAELIKHDQRPCERFCGVTRILNEGPCNPSTCSKVVNYECHLQNSNETPHCFNFVPQRTALCFNAWPCYYCSRSFSLQQCQAYLRIG